jgi:hypothetical protein
MPTLLNRKLRRELSATLSIDRASRGRPIIVEIEPPGVFIFRWKGTRRRYEAGAAKLMQWTIQEAVEQARKEKLKGRKERRAWLKNSKS